MAAGYMLNVNGTTIRTSEALYQACRFPHLPDVQRLIIEEKSPMAAKMRSKPFRDRTRPDWELVRVDIMRWCLKVKLAAHWGRFGALLRETESRVIVEESHKDRFWGAVPSKEDPDKLIGENVLGSLLQEMRALAEGKPLSKVVSEGIPDLRLFGMVIDG